MFFWFWQWNNLVNIKCTKIVPIFCATLYIETAARIELVCIQVDREIRISAIIRVLLSRNFNFVPNSGLRKFGHCTSAVAKRNLIKRQSSVCCWQHLATTVSVANSVSRWPTIVACWSHPASSCVNSMMVDWAWVSVARIGRRQLILVLFNDSEDYNIYLVMDINNNFSIWPTFMYSLNEYFWHCAACTIDIVQSTDWYRYTKLNTLLQKLRQMHC